MSKHVVILKWNPAVSSISMWNFLLDILDQETGGNWSIWEHNRVRQGDAFFLLKVGHGVTGIVAAGELTSEPCCDEDWSGRRRQTYYCDYCADVMLNPETFPILESSKLEALIPGFDWHGGHSGVILSPESGQRLITLFETYLQENAACFKDRLALIQRRRLQNDQCYFSPKRLAMLGIEEN